MVAFGDWGPRLQYVMKALGSMDDAIKKAHSEYNIPREFMDEYKEKFARAIQVDSTRIPPPLLEDIERKQVIRVSGDAKYSANNRMTQAEQAIAEGDHKTAILHLRRAVELQPFDAQIHFHLGASLGQIGEVEEGTKECRIAAQLEPDWEIPKVEVGIILANAERYEEAMVSFSKING